MIDLKAQYIELKSEIDAAIEHILDEQSFIMGEPVSKFEESLRQYLGVKHAYGCASGTDALQLALMALDLGAGDEVITTPFTFAATVEVVALLKAIPVYADIDPMTFNMDVNKVEALITSKTKAIVPVHLYGQAADMDELMEIGRKYDIPVIEDAAQAMGAMYKGRPVTSIGDLACTSFFPAKNLGAFGDAGGVFTNDDTYGNKMKFLRVHGSDKRYVHDMIGVNSRLDSLQAAILDVKLTKLDVWNKRRDVIADLYREGLENVDVVTPTCKSDRTHIYQQFTIRSKSRDALQAHLHKEGIPCAVHYPIPLFKQPAFHDAKYDATCPETIKAAEEVLSLPMYPHMTEAHVEMVVKAIKNFF